MVEMGIHGLASYVAERYDAVSICSLLNFGLLQQASCLGPASYLQHATHFVLALSYPAVGPVTTGPLRHWPHRWIIHPSPCRRARGYSSTPLAGPSTCKSASCSPRRRAWSRTTWATTSAPATHPHTAGGHARSDHHPSGRVLLERWTRLHAAPSPRCGTRVCSLFSTSTDRCAG